MMNHILYLVVLSITLGCTSLVSAKIVSLRCDPPSTIDDWSFDYELQQLSISRTIHEVGNRAYTNIGGRVEEEGAVNEFSVSETIKNSTGFTWIGYQIFYGPSPHALVGSVGIIPETIEASRLGWGLTVTYRPDYLIELTAPSVVLNGESLNMRYKMRVWFQPGVAGYEGVFYTELLGQAVVPEPTTVMFLGAGGMALLRKYRK